jgi:hypothetical protein
MSRSFKDILLAKSQPQEHRQPQVVREPADDGKKQRSPMEKLDEAYRDHARVEQQERAEKKRQAQERKRQELERRRILAEFLSKNSGPFPVITEITISHTFNRINLVATDGVFRRVAHLENEHQCFEHFGVYIGADVKLFDKSGKEQLAEEHNFAGYSILSEKIVEGQKDGEVSGDLSIQLTLELMLMSPDNRLVTLSLIAFNEHNGYYHHLVQVDCSTEQRRIAI